MTKPTRILRGIGEVFAGDRLIRHTEYRLELAAEPSADAAATIVEASIDVSGTPEAFVLSRADHLTLYLEDGRSVPFTLESPRGRIAVHGELPPPIRSSAR